MRPGFTRMELVLTMSTACLMLGLILPAIQAARSDAAETQCRNNLRQIGQAFLHFEKTHGGFPPRRSGFNNGEPYAGWGAHILPYAGEDAVARKYNAQLDFFDPGNKAAVETSVSLFLCPASPAPRVVPVEAQASAKSANPDKDTVYSVQAGACDYISSNGVLAPRGGYRINLVDATQRLGNQRQPMLDNDYLPLSKITDGLSCTLLLIEQAGRPQTWRNGKKKEGVTQLGMAANVRGTWSGWGSISFGSADAQTGEFPGKGDATDCTVNCNNWFGIYGFHARGANVLLCDGSVRFTTPKLDPLTFAYLSMRDDGHLIASNDY